MLTSQVTEQKRDSLPHRTGLTSWTSVNTGAQSLTNDYWTRCPLCALRKLAHVGRIQISGPHSNLSLDLKIPRKGKAKENKNDPDRNEKVKLMRGEN